MNPLIQNKPTSPSQPVYQYPRLGSLELVKTLNYGTTSKVKLGRDLSSKTEYAVKIIKSEFQTKYLSTLEQEGKFLQVLSQEDHPNIVKLVEARPKADYTKKNGVVKKVFALIFEYAEGGDLYECIKAFDNFQEDIARTYFHQLINTVEYIHDRGIIHGDLKLENLLLGGDFSLKIADFSFASYALEETTVPVQRQRLGTIGYMAPELIGNGEYVGQTNDIFACGVILFLMVVGHPPFQKASVQDMMYKFIIKQHFSQFWKQFESRGITFTDSFKNLMNAMFAYEPTERLSISEIKSHAWFTGKTCPVEELKTLYESRKQQFFEYQEEKTKQMQKLKEVKAQRKKEIETKLAQPKLSNFFMKGIPAQAHWNTRSITRGVDQEIQSVLSQDDLDHHRLSREYVFTGYRRLAEQFYNVNQETMFKLILLLSGKLFNQHKVHPEEYKIKGRVLSDNDEFNGRIQIDITHVDDDSCCVCITKIEGALAPFYKFIEEKFKLAIDNTLERFEDKNL